MTIRKIEARSLAKVSGALFVLLGAVVCIPAGIYFAVTDDLLGGMMIAVFGPAVAGLDGILSGLVLAGCFNIASRYAGGIRFETEQG